MKTGLYLIQTAALLCAVVCLFACTKKQKGTFIVKGRLTDTCGGIPRAFYKVRVDFIRREGFKSLIKDNIGSDTTDANGNFEMVCQNWGDGKIDIIGNPNPIVKEFGINDPEGKVYDLGEIPNFSSVEATLKITPLNTFSPTDTLYIGDKWIYPIPISVFTDYLTGPGDYTSNINFKDSASRVRTRKVFWGIGSANKALNSVVVNYSFCGIPEQINEITISK